jgi:hypothetical protein
MHHRSIRLAVALGLAANAAGCAHWRVDQAAAAATGFAAHTLCDDIFISGIDPQTADAERVAPLPGMGLVHWAMQRTVDRAQRSVTVSVAGLARSQAWLREGRGCLSLPADEAAAVRRADAAQPQATLPAGRPAPPPDPWGPAPVTAANPALAAVLGQAVQDAPGAPPHRRHRTKAVLVLQAGRLVGEAYAAGIGVDTPLLGFSATKSVTHALVGVLVGQGRLDVQAPGAVPAWRNPADPRRAVSAEHLLRHTAGLDLLQDNSGFDANARIMYTVRDKAAAVLAVPAARPPGTAWTYTDGHYVLLARLIRDALGGPGADVPGFAQAALFGPLGMRQAVLDVDATGTPMGASHMLASARDWARFGQLYLDDGRVGTQRILPEGWVAMAATPTLDTGYGAGWWTNRRPGLVPGWGAPWGLPSAPADAFFARGFMGNFVVVVPSRQLVLVRLSVSTQRGDDIGETDRLLGAVLAVLPS